MPIGIVFFIVWSLFMILVGVLFFLWGKHTGQFKEIEKTKYQIFEEKELEEWPNRKKKKADSSAGNKGGKA